MQKKQQKKAFVCYHDECLDGFTAAWVAWGVLKNRAQFVALKPGMIPGEQIRNSTVYFFDMCPKKDGIAALKKNGNEVIIVDHHISAKEDIKHADTSLFDTAHSGAMLAWNFFHPKEKAPLLVRYAEDADLWKFSLPRSRDVLSYLDMTDQTFSLWSAISRKMETASGKNAIVQEGMLITKHEEKLISNILKKAVRVSFEGHETYAVNSPVFNSEIGHVLYETFPPMAIIWNSATDGVRVSLRSNGRVDVSKIAQKYGGGGHKRSAGFLLSSVQDIPWKSMPERKKKR